MPSAEQLVGMRSRYAGRLKDRCTVKRPTASTDAWAEESSAYADIATNVPCAYAVSSGSERFAGDTQVVAAGTPIVTFQAGQDVKVRDRIVVAARDLSPEHTVEVSAPPLRATDEIGVRVLGTEVNT